jgi:sulfatase maturation enzyme AslB (radical SAM superfamily)
MSWEVLRAGLDLLLTAKRRALRVTFHGGEPLLALPLIRRALRYLQAGTGARVELQYSIATNGTRLDDAAARFFAEHRFRTLLGCDGAAAAQELRAPGTFAVLDRVLRRLEKNHPDYLHDDVTVQITLTSRNVPHLAESVRYLLSLGVTSVQIAPLMTHDGGWSAETGEELQRQLGVLRVMSLEPAAASGGIPVVLFRPEPASDRGAHSARPCGAVGGEELLVDVDGTVSGCIAFAPSFMRRDAPLLRQAAELATFGHVMRDDVVEGACRARTTDRRGSIFGHVTERHSSYGNCDECEYAHECNVCPASIGHMPGNRDPRRVPDNQCAFNRAVAAERRVFREALPP